MLIQSIIISINSTTIRLELILKYYLEINTVIDDIVNGMNPLLRLNCVKYEDLLRKEVMSVSINLICSTRLGCLSSGEMNALKRVSIILLVTRYII